MLAVLATDAVAEPALLAAALEAAAAVTFNRITVDGSQSTNDTLLLLASGASGARPDDDDLAGAVEAVCADLAGQLLADAEGGTRVVRVQVGGAADGPAALAVARRVADSPLVKAAAFGGDPNWGRVLQAAGDAGVDFDPAAVRLEVAGGPGVAGRTVVVKYGGAAMRGDSLDAFVDDVVLLRSVGVDVVVVHGGGPEISELMARFGKQPAFVDGHRVTDAQTIDLVRMVLVGRVNQAMVGRINTHGRLAVGLSGEDGLLVVARPRVDPAGRDLGFVGDVDAVDPTALRALTDKGLIPVVATVAAGPGGQPYNVTADAVAGAMAAALGAEKLVYLTDVPGLLADLDDPGSLLPRLGLAEVEAMLADGRCSAGMVPKLGGGGGGAPG